MVLRDAYMAWTRRALPFLALPLALTAVVQAVSAGAWWRSGPEPPLGARSLFIAAAVGAIAYARSVRQRETARRGLTEAQLTSLSWRLVTLSLTPSVAGAVLAMMTRSTFDHYLLLAVTLVGIVLLYPRYDQWLAWSAPPEKGDR